jgi:hypothetical protein
MQRKAKLVLSVDASFRRWIEKEAGERRMTMSDLCVTLMQRGAMGEKTDQALTEIRALMDHPAQVELLRQVLATRYVVEHYAKGDIRFPATLGADANAYADKELAKRQTTKKDTEP